MVETRSQKSSEGQKARLEVEVHSDPAMDENQDRHGPEGRGNRRLASESTPVQKKNKILPLPPGPGPRRDVGTVRHLYQKCGDYKITHRQHHDGWRDGKTGNVLIVFRKSEEHFRKLLSVYYGNGYRR